MEKNFQKALFHLYANVDRYSSYCDAIFESFALSDSEKQSLKQLMTSERDGLLLFNQQLRNKHRRSILYAMPKSRDIIGRQFDALLDAYFSCPAEGARDPDDGIRSFADYLGAQIDSQANVSKELEFMRFEAVFAAVSLGPAATYLNSATPPQVSNDLRLSLAGDGALIPCTYDVWAAMNDASLLGVSAHHSPSKLCWFFLFKARSGEVRMLSVAPGLARVLRLFQGGLSLGEVLQSFESESEKIASSTSIQKLLLLGAPFFSPEIIAR